MKKEIDHFEVLRKIKKLHILHRGKLRMNSGFSLGKLNYCLKSLQKKGLIKVQNFKKQKHKSNI